MELPAAAYPAKSGGGVARTFRPSEGMDREGIGATTAKSALGGIGFFPAADMAHDINRPDSCISQTRREHFQGLAMRVLLELNG